MKTRAKGTAPGQYLGFALQPVRLFYHLLRCGPDSIVGLEYADDISIHQEDTALLVEQCKSALKQNPVSDWAIDLWKTLANWGENCASGALDAENTSFHLYVTPVKNAKLAQKLSETKSDAEIDQIFADVMKKRSKRSTIPACEAHLMNFLAVDPSIRRAVIRNFTLVNVDDDPLQAIYDYLDATVSPELVGQATLWGIGKAKELIDSRIRAGDDPLISANTFRIQLRAFVAKYDIAQVLNSLSDPPAVDEVDCMITSSPPFIRQLEIVNASADVKTGAASDYLRASADRTIWADAGMIFEESATEYDEALKKRHGNVKGELEISSADLDHESFGLFLYHRCCNQNAGKIDGREVPIHFLSGSLNALANQLEIGWHPDFENLLKGSVS